MTHSRKIQVDVALIEDTIALLSPAFGGGPTVQKLEALLPKPDPDAEAREVLASAMSAGGLHGVASDIRTGNKNSMTAVSPAIQIIRTALDKARAEKPVTSPRDAATRARQLL